MVWKIWKICQIFLFFPGMFDFSKEKWLPLESFYWWLALLNCFVPFSCNERKNQTIMAFLLFLNYLRLFFLPDIFFPGFCQKLNVRFFMKFIFHATLMFELLVFQNNLSTFIFSGCAMANKKSDCLSFCNGFESNQSKHDIYAKGFMNLRAKFW